MRSRPAALVKGGGRFLFDQESPAGYAPKLMNISGQIALSTVVILAAILASHLLIRKQINQNQRKTMQEFDDLTSDVESNGEVVASAVTLFGNLAQLLKDSANDPAAVRALATKLETQKQALADAVVANTPVAPGA